MAWPRVQHPTSLDWQRPATYKSRQASLLTKAEQARGTFRWLWCEQVHRQKAEVTQQEQSQKPKSMVTMLHSWGWDHGRRLLGRVVTILKAGVKQQKTTTIPRQERIPSKPLHCRQDTHLVTSVTISCWPPRQLCSSSHFSPPSHAALNINCW